MYMIHVLFCQQAMTETTQSYLVEVTIFSWSNTKLSKLIYKEVCRGEN